MLILSRRANESVNIGDDITVVVTSIKNGVVRLGFKAPKDVAIRRDDIKECKDAKEET